MMRKQKWSHESEMAHHVARAGRALPLLSSVTRYSHCVPYLSKHILSCLNGDVGSG